MRRRKRRNRTGIYLVMLVAALFVGTLAVHGYSLRANCQKLATEQHRCRKEALGVKVFTKIWLKWIKRFNSK